jgi:hypothetical protein
MTVMVLLTRETIEAALARLDAELGRMAQRASLYLVCGAVMRLVFRARDVTRSSRSSSCPNPSFARGAAR